MVSKFLRFCLITTVIINIIFFIFTLFIFFFPYYYDTVTNEIINNIFDEFILSMFIIDILLSPFSLIDFDTLCKIFLIFYTIANILFFNMILKMKYSKLIYFIFIIINILLTVPPIYLYVFGGRGTILDILTNYRTILNIFTGKELFYNIIFFLEVIVPIIYLKNYKSMLKN